MHDEENYVFIGRNKVINLTIKENKILALLIQNKGRVITYKQLCELIYGDIDYYIKECIRNKIFKLRKKLKDEVEILTVQGVGYKIPNNIYKNIDYCPICGRKLRM